MGCIDTCQNQYVVASCVMTFVLLTNLQIENYRNTIDLASTDKTTMRVLEDNSPLIVAALK